MKYSFCLLLGLFFSLNSTEAQSIAWRNKVSPEVLAAFNQGHNADVIVSFKAQADISQARNIKGKLAKAQFVFSRLQANAQQSQKQALALLQGQNIAVNSLFLVNSLALTEATEAVIAQIAALPEVRWVSFDPWVYFPGPLNNEPLNLESRGNIEWGVQKVNAPALWALGHSGQGITIGGADTGYEWTHPALQAHYRGWDVNTSVADHQYNWHDAIHTFSPLNLDSTGNPGVNPCGYDSPDRPE